MCFHESDNKNIYKYFLPQNSKWLCSACWDIPLKLVLQEIDAQTTQLSFKNPVGSLQGYMLDAEMAAELLERVQGMVAF